MNGWQSGFGLVDAALFVDECSLFVDVPLRVSLCVRLLAVNDIDDIHHYFVPDGGCDETARLYANGLPNTLLLC